MARVVARGHAQAAKASGGLVVEVAGARISLSRDFDAKLFGDVVRALGAGVTR
jgi:hypothetical protein